MRHAGRGDDAQSRERSGSAVTGASVGAPLCDAGSALQPFEADAAASAVSSSLGGAWVARDSRVGRCHIHSATAAQHSAGSHFNVGSVTAAQMEPVAIMAKANWRARRGMARCSRQSSTMGPNRGWVRSQRSQRLLPREKQAAASSTKGVVGRSGRKMPAIPSSRLITPAISQGSRRQRAGCRVVISAAGARCRVRGPKGEQKEVEAGPGRGREAPHRDGADYPIRTDDLPLTRRLLYQLS